MNVGSKVAVVLLLLAVVLCPFAACAMAAGQTSQASHPCCPSGKTHHSPVQQSDCKCVSAQPPASQVALNTGITVLAEAPVVDTEVAADAGHALISVHIALSDQNSFLAVHQFRI